MERQLHRHLGTYLRSLIRFDSHVARELAAVGVDVVDCSAGGFLSSRFEVGPGYLVPNAARVRRDAGVVTPLLLLPEGSNGLGFQNGSFGAAPGPSSSGSSGSSAPSPE